MGEENALGDILNSLLQNPEIMKTVAALAGGGASDTKDENSAVQQSNSPPDSQGISIPPDILSRLPQMLSALSSSDITPKLSAPKNGSSHTSAGTDAADGKRKDLLRALKPFLSEKRCAMIDGLLQFEGLAGIIGTLYKNGSAEQNENK